MHSLDSFFHCLPFNISHSVLSVYTPISAHTFPICSVITAVSYSRYSIMLRRTLASARLAVPKRSAHTISTPTLINLDKRWESMSPDEQADIQSQLAKRQEGPWSELTPVEKQAAYFVAFGEHGPRSNVHPPGFQYKVLLGTVLGLVASSALFYAIRTSASLPPRTMTKVSFSISCALLCSLQFKDHNMARMGSLNRILNCSTGISRSHE